MDALGSLYAIAAQQHRALHIGQARTVGLSTSVAARRLRRNGWEVDHHGVWRPPGEERTLLQRTSAALLAAGPVAAATGSTALWLHGVLDAEPERPTIVVPARGHVPRELAGVRVIGSRTFDPVEVELVRRLRATPVARAFQDWCVPGADPIEVGLAEVRDRLLTALQRRQTTPEEIVANAARCKGMPGMALLDEAFAQATQSGADSPLALRVVERLAREGLTPDAEPAVVDLGTGVTLHPDITFRQLQSRTRPRRKPLAIEVDGKSFHRASDRQVADDDRKDRAYDDAGWRVRRITWFECEHRWPEWQANVRRALGL